jgi:hypothetical protein
VRKGGGTQEGKTVEERLFGHCQFVVWYGMVLRMFLVDTKDYRTYLNIDNQSRFALPGQSTLRLPSRRPTTQSWCVGEFRGEQGAAD